jgi:hypothetical protein
MNIKSIFSLPASYFENSKFLEDSLCYDSRTKVKVINTYLTFKFSQTQLKTNCWAGDSCISSSTDTNFDSDCWMLLCMASSISANEGATSASVFNRSNNNSKDYSLLT